MKKNIIFYLLLIISVNDLISQDKSEFYCNELIYSNHHKRLPESIQEYIKGKYIQKSKFLNSKSELRMIERQVSTTNSILFGYKDYSIIVRTIRDSIALNKDSVNLYYGIETEEDEEYSKIKFYLNGKIGFYGNIDLNEIKNNYFYFDRFDKIEISKNGKIYKVQDTLINSFINPNLFINYLAIKPLEVYKMKSKNIFCIYFTGQFDVYTENDKEYFIDQHNNTYYVKIVFDIETNKIEILELNYNYLKYYGWPLCKDTWLF